MKVNKSILILLVALSSVIIMTACSDSGGSSNAHDPAFITTWKTDNNGLSGVNEIIISTEDSSGSLFTVDWGDGNIEYDQTGNITHYYNKIGVYTVKITGDFPRIYSYQRDPEKLLSVENWGDIKWTTMSYAFAGCSDLVVNASDAPDLSQVTDMTAMFSRAISFNQDIGHWDVSNVKWMTDLFNGATSFNQPLGDWNTSNVEMVASVFKEAASFNQDIGNWDVSKVKILSSVFDGAASFNQPLDDWNTSIATDMGRMFQNAISFDQNISDWDVSEVNAYNEFDRNTSLSWIASEKPNFPQP